MSSSQDLGIVLDTQSTVPVFTQICDVVRQRVEDGALGAGTRMPTTRALAQALGVAVNTVAKAYLALEEEGVIEGRGRLGTFVVEPGAGQREALRFARAMKDAGLTLAQAQSLLHAAWGTAGPR